MTARPTPETPGPGQESVWDYPRPPRVEPTSADIELVLGGHRVARTSLALRVLETSHPPTYYLPTSAFAEGVLRAASGSSVCEWKGTAAYLDVVTGPSQAPVVAQRAAWHYPDPLPAFADLAGHVAVYPSAMDQVIVDGETVSPQPGGFYGGWVTSKVVGPFKGGPGTLGW